MCVDSFNAIGSNTSSNADSKASSMLSKLNFNNLVMQLRKLCNHPYLILEDIQSIPDDLYDKYLISSCGKLCVLDRLLQVLLTQGKIFYGYV